MNKRALFVLAGMVLFMGGCSLAPRYTRPAAPVPAHWPSGAAYNDTRALSGIPIAREVKWREFFPDQKIRKVIEMALRNNRDLRLAALNVAKAQALYGVQRADLFPSLSVAGTGTKQRSASDFTLPGASRSSKQFSVDFGIAAWEIDFFGHIRSLKDQALQEYLATEAARRGARIALISGAASAYLTLAADRENLKLAESTLVTQQTAYGLINRQYEMGVATKLDLRRAQIPVDTAKVEVARYTRQVAQDTNALNLLAGSSVPENFLPADLSSIQPPKAIAPGLPSDALLNRPDIQAAEHQLKGAYAFVGVARSAFFPRISLTTSIGTASNELSGLFGSGADTWNFAPQIAMPIFDARTWAAYRVSKAQRKILLTRYEKTIQTAFREVADALAARVTINQQVAAQQSLVDAVAQTYQLSNKRYANGIDNYLGVLDAQRSLYAAKQGLVSLRLAKFINQVRGYAVLGGGDEVNSANVGSNQSMLDTGVFPTANSFRQDIFDHCCNNV